MRQTVIILSLLVACNQVYGIDETAPAPADRDSDGDGVLDPDDNCTLFANDQSNLDGDTLGDDCDPCPEGDQIAVDSDLDGVDDGCDPCLSGSNHNEDGDAALDGCDVCPGIMDGGQDSDGDGVGDVCDPTSSVTNRRLFFDAFAPPDARWNTGFNAWHPTGEGFASDAAGGAPGPWNRAATVSRIGWQISAEIILPATPVEGQLIGVGVVTQSGDVTAACTLSYSGGQWHLPTAGDPVTVASPLRVTMKAESTATPSIFNRLCTFGTVTESVPGTLVAYDFYPMLALYVGKGEFVWIDVVE